MPDHNSRNLDFLRALAAQAGNQQAVEQLRVMLRTPDGAKAARQISALHAEELERAAKAAQNGNMAEAARLAQNLMQSKEGAQLAAQIKSIFHM